MKPKFVTRIVYIATALVCLLGIHQQSEATGENIGQFSGRGSGAYNPPGCTAYGVWGETVEQAIANCQAKVPGNGLAGCGLNVECRDVKICKAYGAAAGSTVALAKKMCLDTGLGTKYTCNASVTCMWAGMCKASVYAGDDVQSALESCLQFHKENPDTCATVTCDGGWIYQVASEDRKFQRPLSEILKRMTYRRTQ
jgi:hypothetical protein